MSINVSSKLPNIGTTIFTKMSSLSNKHGAINLSQGFPEFDCSEELKHLVNQAMVEGKNQYAPMQGNIDLRVALSEKMTESFGNAIDPDTDITICAGATQAIYTAISAVVQHDDEVIVFDPAYDCYEPAIKLNGGKTIHIELNPIDYSIPWNVVREKISSKTKLIIINSPNNPSGSVLTTEDLNVLNEICEEANCLVLSDEVYEHICFDETKHASVLGHEQLKKRSFAVFSFGKTFHITGWKLGYCVAPENLMTEFRKVHQFLVFSCNHPSQIGLAKYLKDPSTYRDLASFFEAKRDVFTEALSSSRFKVLPCKGTYFQLLDYSSITNEKDTDFAIRLTTEFKVASIPISVFYDSGRDNKVLRFCFAKNDDTLLKAASILCKI